MPRPVYRDEDLGQLIRQAIFLQQVARPDIRFESDLPAEPMQISRDARQLAQVLTNILQNAIDAIDGRERPGAGAPLATSPILVRPGGEGRWEEGGGGNEGVRTSS